MYCFYKRNIEKESRNRDNILLEREELEDELKLVALNYQEAVRNNEDIKNEKKKEKKKMETKEEQIQVNKLKIKI